MVKPVYFFGLAIILAIASMIALRYNMQTAASMRQDVLQKDQAGQDVSQDIQELRQYVLNHAQTSVSFELTASYERAVKKAENEASETETGRLYQQAQEVCDRQGVSSVAQAQCVQNYVNARLNPGQNPKPFEPPERTDFMYSFASPAWAPDLAGFLLLGALISAIVAFIIYLKHLIYFEHHKS